MKTSIETHFEIDVPDHLNINGMKIKGELVYGDYDKYGSYYINDNIKVEEDMEYIVYTYEYDFCSDIYTILIETFATCDGEMSVWLFKDGKEIEYQNVHYTLLNDAIKHCAESIERLVKG